MLPIFLAFLFATCVLAQVGPTAWTASPFNPPSLPLAVKSPYVNAWAPLGNDSIPISIAWARTWDTTLGDNGLGILGWYVAVRVDGTAYKLLGNASTPAINSATQTGFVFTPTRSSFALQAGPVNVNMTFLSPIEPTDLVRQSIPFSYMYITAESNDGSSHEVQIYSGVSGEWISGDNSLDSNWTINESSNFVYLQMGLTSPSPYSEVLSRPQDATLYHSVKNTAKVSWQIGPTYDVEGFFANGTGLNKAAEAGHHGIGVPYFNTLGIACDLGSVSSTSDPVVYTHFLMRDPVVQYTNIRVQIEERNAYYWSKFSNVHDVIEDVLDHFEDALTTAINLDDQILGAGGQIAGDYANLLSLSARQAMGSLEYTLRKENGAFNMSDVKVFMKDIGGIGSGGVNAVDVLYAAMPAYLYLNPAILGYLLSPLLEYQESAQYTNPYAAQDLGKAFPNATGDTQGHDQKIEQSANMLVMALAHAQATGDGNLLAQHYDLLNAWTNYLVNNTMTPEDQTTSSSDSITSMNQTNLVLKGIIGIGAMAKISEYTKRTSDQSRFDGTAKQYVQQWTSLVSGSNQLALNFGSTSSGLIYNLYADKLLQLGLIDSSVYDLQTAFYRGQISPSKYGIPLDSSNPSSATRSDWMMFAAASVSDTSVRSSMISQIHAYASANLENRPFAILYNPSNGSQIGGFASPAQGAMFAPLALNLPIQSVTFTAASSGGSSSSKAGVIAGVTVGGIAFASIVVAGLIFYCRRRERKPTGFYNRTDRIEPVKPDIFASESVLEPLHDTVHPGMHDLRNSAYSQQGPDSTTVVGGANTTSFPTGMPLTARSLTKGELAVMNNAGTPKGVSSQNRSSGVGSSSGGGSTWSGSTASAAAAPQSAANSRGPNQEEWRSEVDNLRREIERIKQERTALGELPPSYEDDLETALRAPPTPR